MFSGCDKNFDIGFLHDVSGSTANHFDLAKKFILSLVSTFTISQSATRTSYLAFSTKPDEALAAFNMHNSYADFEKNIRTFIQGGKLDFMYIFMHFSRHNKIIFKDTTVAKELDSRCFVSNGCQMHEIELNVM